MRVHRFGAGADMAMNDEFLNVAVVVGLRSRRGVSIFSILTHFARSAHRQIMRDSTPRSRTYVPRSMVWYLLTSIF